jgi:hypothetical protein
VTRPCCIPRPQTLDVAALGHRGMWVLPFVCVMVLLKVLLMALLMALPMVYLPLNLDMGQLHLL